MFYMSVIAFNMCVAINWITELLKVEKKDALKHGLGERLREESTFFLSEVTWDSDTIGWHR